MALESVDVRYSGAQRFHTVYLASDPVNFNDVTTSKGTEIDNSQTPHGFPFTTIRYNVEIEVTAAMSDAYWDNYFTGGTRISGSTFAKNCFGYSFGMPFYVPTPQAVNAILADEFEAANYGEDTDPWSVFVKAEPAVSAIDYCDNSYGGTCSTCYCTETREKMASSGVYKYEYLCPGGGEPSAPWTFYKHAF